ncbi:hypothetical protein BaRGS_00036773, partial [Batillaria attramentaria]
MLLVSAGIGIFYGCRGSKQRTTKEFLLANRSMSIIPVAISILVSFMSAILILGTPAEMYMSGTEYFVYVFGICFAIIIAALVFVPLLYPLRMTSSFEYLERRFNSRAAKLTGTIIMIVQQILYMGIASFAPSTALEAVTGFPVWATIIIVGLVSTFYTTLGGMKAVVWTDVFQSVIMLAGLLAVVIRGSKRLITMMTVTEMLMTLNHRIDDDKYNHAHVMCPSFNADPTQRHSFWSLIVGGMIGWTATYGCNQASVQRFCSLPSLAGARKSVLLNIIGTVILLTITCLAGIVIFAYYVEQGCDPLSSGRVGNSNQIVPYFVMEVLDIPGLPGLFVSCLFSGALSTMSSCLNALAAVTWEDFLKPVLGERLSEAQKTWVTKLLVLIYGGAGIGMAFMAQGLGGTVLQASLSFTGAASGPILGLFLLGGVFPWANGKGAVVGGVLGLIFPLWIRPMDIDDIDPKYLIPIFDRLFCCLPASWRKTLRCHKEFPNPEDIKENDLETEIVIPDTDSKPVPEAPPEYNVAVLNGKASLKSFDSGRGSDVGRDATSVDGMSNGTYVQITYILAKRYQLVSVGELNSRNIVTADVATSTSPAGLVVSHDVATTSQVNDLVLTADVATASPVNDLVVTTDVATASPVNDLVVTTNVATASPVNDLVVTTDVATASPVNDLVVTTDVATASPVNDLVVTTDVATASPVKDLVVTTDVATSPVKDLVVTTDVATSPVKDLVVTTDVATASPVNDLVVTTDVATSPVKDLVVTTDVATASPVKDLVVTTDVATSPVNDLVSTDFLQLVDVGTSTSDAFQQPASAPQRQLTTVKRVVSSDSESEPESEPHQVETPPRQQTAGVAQGNQVNVGEMTIHIHVARVGDNDQTGSGNSASGDSTSLSQSAMEPGAERPMAGPGASINHVGTLNIHHHAHQMPTDWQGNPNVLIARVDWEAEREGAWSETLEMERRRADDRVRRLHRKLEREKRKAANRMRSLAESYTREWEEDVVKREEERARDHQQFMDQLTEVQRSAEERLSNLQSELREERERGEQRLAAMMEQHEDEKRQQQEQVMTFVIRVEGQVRQLCARVAAHVNGSLLQTVVQRLFDEFDVRLLAVGCGLQFLFDAPVAQWVSVVERQLEIQRVLSDLIPEGDRDGLMWAEVTQCGESFRDVDLQMGRALPEGCPYFYNSQARRYQPVSPFSDTERLSTSSREDSKNITTADVATSTSLTDLVVSHDVATAPPVNDLVVTTDVATASPVNDLVVTTDVATASPVNDLVVTTDVATASPVNDLVVATDVATASPVYNFVELVNVGTFTSEDQLNIVQQLASASDTEQTAVKRVSSSESDSELESEPHHQVETPSRQDATGVAQCNQVNVGEMTIHIHVASVSASEESVTEPEGDTNVLIARVDWEAERERAWSQTLEMERRQADDRVRRLHRKLEKERRKAVERVRSLAECYIREWGEDVVEREEERARDHQQFMDQLTEVQRSAEERLSNLQSELREERERGEQRLAAMMEQHENEKRQQQEQVMTFVLRVEGQVRQLCARVAAHVDGRRLQTVVQRLFDEFNVRLVGLDCGLQFLLNAPVAQWVSVVERHLEIQRVLSDLIPEDAREGVTWAEVTQCGESFQDVDLQIGRALPEGV